MRNKLDFTLKDTYTFYKNNYDTPVKLDVYNKVIKDFNLALVNLLIRGIIVKLPYSLGTLYVKRYKLKFKFRENGNLDTFNGRSNRVDWKITKELWLTNPETKGKKYLVHDNEHSDGYKVKVVWNIFKTKNAILKTFNFKPCRKFVRDLANYIKTNKKVDYVE